MNRSAAMFHLLLAAGAYSEALEQALVAYRDDAGNDGRDLEKLRETFRFAETKLAGIARRTGETRAPAVKRGPP